jgi:predicted kinase
MGEITSVQAVLFIGCQASGKSTFYQSRFSDSHIRINLDMLRTRHRENLLLRACLEMKQKFVVDNTNPTRKDRRRYIESALEARFDVVGYYFESKIEHLLKRNQQRPENSRVPEIAVRGTHNKLEIPTFDEGFSALWYVRILENGEFSIEEWRHEI